MMAPCPAKMPRDGKVTAAVKPALRALSMRRSAGLIRSAARSQLVFEGRSSGPRAGAAEGVVAGAGVAGALRREPPAGASGGAASGIPSVPSASISPGYTVKPSPSITQASAGTSTFAPTSWISPSRIKTVPRSSTAPLTVTTRAPRMANAEGGFARTPAAPIASSNSRIVLFMFPRGAGGSAWLMSLYCRV